MIDIQEHEEQETDANFEDMLKLREKERTVYNSIEKEGVLAGRGEGPVRNPRDLVLISLHDTCDIASENPRITMPVYLHEGYSEAIQMPMEHASYRSHNGLGEHTSRAAINRARFARHGGMQRNARDTLYQILRNLPAGAPAQRHAASCLGANAQQQDTSDIRSTSSDAPQSRRQRGAECNRY